MGGAPTTSVITIDGHAIEYRLERREPAAVLILHGGHMSARCRFGEETFLEAGYSVLVTSELVQRVILMCPTSFRPWPDSRERRLAYAAFAPGVQRATWGMLHFMLRKAPEKHLAGILENLTTLDDELAVRRLGTDIGKITDFLLCCQSGRGFLIDLRAPTDVSNDVAQPTLILATRNDGAVSFDHAEYLVATLPHAMLVEVDTPTHLLWLGGGSDRTAAETASFITT